MGHSSQQGLGQEGGSDLRQGGEYEASNRVRIGSISVEWNTQSNFNIKKGEGFEKGNNCCSPPNKLRKNN